MRKKFIDTSWLKKAQSERKVKTGVLAKWRENHHQYVKQIYLSMIGRWLLAWHQWTCPGVIRQPGGSGLQRSAALFWVYFGVADNVGGRASPKTALAKGLLATRHKGIGK
jgi:hypothetical protein